ncbi:Regulator of drug sensitivity 2 [Vanrija pseudolonga]|uniref:Regulator of drug sensitivity 2 n=1 Tax=Vanrija pseudolonga TaxID=143232 RepID=A0AAF0YIZ2_9TREE|nr:Regulator of drug sensitivity 2 [Vanrija pseudolonga]
MTDSTPQTMLSTAVRPTPLASTMPRSGWKQQPPAGPAAAVGGGGPSSAAAASLTPKRDRGADSHDESHKSKKAKRKGGKACVYCRRSHMVCEGGRPCERCIKRDIAHLCRDVTPPSSAKKPDQPAAPVIPKTEPPPLVFDTGSSSWPLLPPSTTAPEPQQPEAPAPPPALDLGVMTRDVSNVSSGGWGVGDNAEFGILSDMLKTLRVPTLPGGFVDVLSQVVRRGSNDPSLAGPQLAGGTSSALQLQGAAPAQSSSSSSASGQAPPAAADAKGKGKAEPFSSISRIEQYLLAAADQPDGTRAARLTQVIRAKYEAGLLKPYDYIKGYERMNRWMDSGRAARIDASRAPSPTKGNKRYVVPPPPSGSSISPDSRRRILAALEVFRPKFRRIAKELTDLDLVFVEEANERLMLQYDRALASIHTPSCIWRRTGEIQKANQEFASLTGIPAPLFRNGQLCVYELMDEDSAVRFWEGYGKVASEKGQSHLYTYCTLKIPLSLTRAQQSRTQGNTPSVVPVSQHGSVPDLMLPQAAVGPLGPSGQPGGTIDEEYRVIRTCFSMTIRRDRYEIPVAIMGQWIPIL